GPGPQPLEHDVAELVDLARDLRELPRESFRARLKADLERRSSMATISQASISQAATPQRQTATPTLRVKGVAKAIEFYAKAFDARELMRFEVGGDIPHAEIAIGNSIVMLGEESIEHGFPAPGTLGGSPVLIHLWVEDTDAAIEKAVQAGARVVRPAA